MKKPHALLLLTFFMLSLFSCKKDKKNCVQVRYISGYCPYTGSSYVEVLEPNDDATARTENGHTTYTMALFNVPEEYRVIGKVFFVKYQYDADLPEPEARPCPANSYPANMFVAKSVSLTGCDN